MNNECCSALLESYQARLIPLNDGLTAAAFPLMKIFPASFCVKQAREEGLVNNDSLVVETSSGTMALGLAIVCRWHAHKLTIVTDYACDDRLRRRLEYLGARVEIVPGPAATGGYQRARLDRLNAIRNENENHWWLNQYDNPGNPGAYGSFAAHLVETLGQIDCVVGTVGSGGSLCGTGSYLRMLYPDLKLIAVDTFGSVLFGHPDQPRKLRGLGNSIHPRNLDHTVIDEVHWVTAAEAYAATRELYAKTTLFCGGTSGACWLVARHWAARYPHRRVVAIFPDDGYRYLDSVYDDQYLLDNQLWIPELPTEPREVSDPREAEGNWSFMHWDRRAYDQVVNAKGMVHTA
jgi:S-sulfo-L-cysteine synthase (3-phospho-L-serine-dependent)